LSRVTKNHTPSGERDRRQKLSSTLAKEFQSLHKGNTCTSSGHPVLPCPNPAPVASVTAGTGDTVEQEHLPVRDLSTSPWRRVRSAERSLWSTDAALELLSTCCPPQQGRAGAGEVQRAGCGATTWMAMVQSLFPCLGRGWPRPGDPPATVGRGQSVKPCRAQRSPLLPRPFARSKTTQSLPLKNKRGMELKPRSAYSRT